jgi:hypothetical protein
LLDFACRLPHNLMHVKAQFKNSICHVMSLYPDVTAEARCGVNHFKSIVKQMMKCISKAPMILIAHSYLVSIWTTSLPYTSPEVPESIGTRELIVHLPLPPPWTHSNLKRDLPTQLCFRTSAGTARPRPRHDDSAQISGAPRRIEAARRELAGKASA